MKGGGEEWKEIDLPPNNSDPGHTVLTRLECGVGTITLHLGLFLHKERNSLMLEKLINKMQNCLAM